MASPKQMIIRESIAELRKILNTSIPTISKRIRVLIEFKKNEHKGISKRAVADLVGVNHNSVQAWRKMYLDGGIKSILTIAKRTGRPTSFTKEEHAIIEKKLKDPMNGLRGYSELLNWAETEFKKEIKYNTLLKYSMRNFGSKIKTARKSHRKKDPEAVALFKKTSVKSAKKPRPKNKTNSTR